MRTLRSDEATSGLRHDGTSLGETDDELSVIILQARVTFAGSHILTRAILCFSTTVRLVAAALAEDMVLLFIVRCVPLAIL